MFLFSIFCCSIDICLILLFLHIILHLVPYREKSKLDMNLQLAERETLIQLNVLDEYMMQDLFNTKGVQQQRKY
jgi:hypothetical protein